MKTWIAIPGYEGIYEISDEREVKSLRRIVRRWGKDTVQREKIMKPFYKGKNKSAYVQLNKNGRQRQMNIDRMYLRLFEDRTFEKTSKYKGVYLKGNRWQVNVKSYGKLVWIGSFETEEEANRARNNFILKEQVV